MINPAPLRVYTCTPAPFRGDHTFFVRDSGLTCRGLQSLGVESRAIALAPAQDGDEPDLIRARMTELESVPWWATHRLDGVVLYAWGDGRYWRIARAIKESGARLYVHMDASGLLSPVADWADYVRDQARVALARWGVVRGGGWFIGSMLYRHSWGLYWSDWRRVVHLQAADCIGAVSPIAVERVQRYCRRLGGESLARRVALVPAPVSQYFEFKEWTKERQIIAVGRWGIRDAVKRPELLMRTLEYVLATVPDVKAVVAGRHPERLIALMNTWNTGLRTRVTATGVLRNDQLREHYCRSQVSICSSRSESFHIASAEAVCCGCSVVGPDIPTLPGIRYFASKNSGTLSEGESPEAIGRAVLEELALWDAGQRDPVVISREWTAELHADKVAHRILDLLGLKTAGH